MEEIHPQEFLQKKFESPQEELDHLREAIDQVHEAQSSEGDKAPSKEEVTEELLQAYDALEPDDVLAETQTYTTEEGEQITLELSPEPHDHQMEELLGILLGSGVKAALDVVKKMNNPHLSDDFHRFLVQYLQRTDRIPGLKESSQVFKGVNMTLYEITLPEGVRDEHESFTDLIGAMEQFYAGMLSVGNDRKNSAKNHFSLEIAISNDTDSVVVYAAIPNHKKDLFHKQITGFYEDAIVTEVTDDYNIFHTAGEAVGATASFEKKDVLPLRLGEEFNRDPINSIINAFSQLQTSGEGAAIQFVIQPAGDRLIKRYTSVLEEVKQGKSVSAAYNEATSTGHAFWQATKDVLTGGDDKKDSDALSDAQQQAVEKIGTKLTSSIVSTNIRIVASAHTRVRAQAILDDISSAFNQFDDPQGNALAFHTQDGKKLQWLFHAYSYREFSERYELAMSLKELAGVFHFPAGISSSPQLKQSHAQHAPAPMVVPDDGTFLGFNEYRGTRKKIFLEPQARMRHFYTIGQTGTGKTNLLKQMAMQDIAQGNGCCFIDPHGSDLDDILATIPKERLDDVIYFDPAHTKRPMGLNMLEYDPAYPEQKTFVVNEMLSIFKKLFSHAPEGLGPMFEQYFRNATLLAIDDPEEPSTLLEVSRVLSDASYRAAKLQRCTNPVVVQFWEEIAEKAGGESQLENIVPYVTSKFDQFLANDIMRPIIAQQASSFNIRTVMDEKKILLVNLSKGRLGDINANLLGLILVGKILMAALSRVDVGEGQRTPFYLYIDEFQNVTTDSIAQILSEARKYQLSLNLAHQFVGQLPEEIKDAVFGNVGNMALFRVGADDAEYLKTQVAPTFTADDLMSIDNFQAYVRMLINNQPAKPFNIKTVPAPEGNEELIPRLKEYAYHKYGKTREEVEAEIKQRYDRIKRNG